MARVRAPLMSLEARGSLADLQFQQRGTRSYAGESSKARQPQTPEQLAQRDIFRFAKTSWLQLDPGERALYAAAYGSEELAPRLWEKTCVNFGLLARLYYHVPLSIPGVYPYVMPDDFRTAPYPTPSLAFHPEDPARLVLENLDTPDMAHVVIIRQRPYFGIRKSCHRSKLVATDALMPELFDWSFAPAVWPATLFIQADVVEVAQYLTVSSHSWAVYNHAEIIQL